ncbi:dienelactone hydrolase family protein [Phenylobacterium sp.]|uniref:dienelactone hydrolase family protein n=1 Tax=Phenylobacterium sp. TaxID=1871053 RepID=UPI002DF55DBD|nr:dienelactone hydrolase family protein [Phenylobacterium sp.]
MPVRTSYVAFATPTLTVAGKLNTMANAPGPTPGVVICHGSDGVDGRGEFHAAALNAAGVATLEIDMWAARGSARGAAARPRSPVETLPDAFAAKAFLAAQPEVDGGRIGIMGFSWGGVVTLLAAAQATQGLSGDTPGFRGHVALYPVCWAYEQVPGLSLADLTGAPVLIQTGDADAYDDPDGLDQLMARLPPASRAVIRGVTHPGAGHGFDRDLPAQTIVDPFAHKGQGGPVLMEFHPKAARRARELTVAFFEEALGA